jgi:hypothetical protein
MARHQLFLVHGIGDFHKDWSLSIQKLLRDAYAQYAIPASLAWEADFQLVEITYNDIFDEIREAWRQNAEAASQALVASGLGLSSAKQLVEAANGATGDDFFRTHILDVVLYRFFKPITERVGQSVRKQILERLNAFPSNETPSWSILGHSLGSAVVHDTLHAMFTQLVDGRLLGDRFKPDFVFMVANVSRVLWGKGGDFFASEVRPHSLESRGMCFKYCNYDHVLDPFTKVERFHPPPAEWFPPGGDVKALYEYVQLAIEDIQDVNVDGLAHYLSHPDVHVSLFRTLLWPTAITKDELDAARAAWRRDALNAAKRKAVATLLTEFKVTGVADWMDIVDSIVRYRQLVLERGGDARNGETAHA